MYLLKILTGFSILYAGYIFFTWEPYLPTTPLEAFHQVKKSYQNNDSRKMSRLLCSKGIENINKAIKLIKEMTPETRQNLADKTGLKEQKLMKLSAEDYIKIQFHLNNKTYIDKIAAAFNYQIKNIEKHKNSVKIITANNIELTFVKEGPYWLFKPEYYK